jgi:rod shape-determining protein MreC
VNADVQNGDLFVTSGIDGVYPPGLPVAVVTNIERNAQSFARIICAPAGAVSSYTRVAVLSDPPPRPPNPLKEPAPVPAPPKPKSTERTP